MKTIEERQPRALALVSMLVDELGKGSSPDPGHFEIPLETEDLEILIRALQIALNFAANQATITVNGMRYVPERTQE